VFGGGLVAAAALVLLWERTGTARATALPRWPTLAVLAVAAVACLVNGRYSSQHLVTDRDPGVYATHAVWLADHHHLLVDAPPKVFRGVPGLRWAQGGYGDHGSPNGPLYPQFIHLPAALFATAKLAGGVRGLFVANAVVGSAALLAVYAFATRLVRPWTAAAVTAALAANLVQVHFSRDAYSEPVAELALFAGLWLWRAAQDERSAPRAAVAGAVLGAAMMARVDSWVLLPAVAFFVFFEGVTDDSAAPRRALAWMVVGLAGATALGVADGLLFSRAYIRDLGPSASIAPFLGVVVVAGGLALARPAAGRLVDVFRYRRLAFARGAAGAVVLAAGLFWFVRPHVQTVHGPPLPSVAALQTREHLPVDPTRTYDEQTVSRLGWYTGPVALGAGFVGIALLVGRAVADRRHASATGLFLAVFGTTTALYIWSLRITPDHIWATRRFLPLTIPGLLIGAGVAVERLWRAEPWRVPARVGAGAVLAATLVFPLAVLYPVRYDRTDAGMLTMVRTMCDDLPADAAVVVTSDTARWIDMPQTIRDFCDVPAAASPRRITTAKLATFRAAATSAHKRLFLVGSSGIPDVDPAAGLQPRLVAKRELTRLEATIGRRPKRMQTQTFLLYVTPA
jgi:hypothetical protein